MKKAKNESVIRQGVLSVPSGTQYFLTVRNNKVILLSSYSGIKVKRPNQYNR